MTCRPSEPCGAAECEWCADQTSGPPDDDAGLFDAIVAEIERREVSRPTGMPLPVPVDWHALYSRTNDVEWLVEDVWPVGRQLHIHAARKTGKSLLMLHIAASLAAGRDPFSGRRQEPVRVMYLDYEMTEDDLLERLDEMGYGPDDLTHLSYYLFPAIAPLDTPEGGRALLELVRRDQCAAVVLDTVSRVVEGEENSNDTFRALYRNTGLHLKAEGVALARLDHEGHEGGRSRGASAKADDVDIVWQLKAIDGGLSLVRKACRMSYVGEHVDLAKLDDPLRFKRTSDAWPAGTREKADQLDRLGVPLDASKRAAREAIKTAGEAPGRNEVLLKALAFRRTRLEVTP
ncbi:MAG: hypothetical protein CL424_14590 [Acidimicrobiaceae bacterium]|nr:hypothetical protein [Acidimicrobiaceae bacterium]